MFFKDRVRKVARVTCCVFVRGRNLVCALSWPRHVVAMACAGDLGGNTPAWTPLHEVGDGTRCSVSSMESLSGLPGHGLELTGGWALFWVFTCFQERETFQLTDDLRLSVALSLQEEGTNLSRG